MAAGLEVLFGAAVLVVVLTDLITTAVAPSRHGGWLTRRVGVALWGGIRRTVRDSRRVLQLAGLGLVVGLIITWVAALLLGWTLVLHGAADIRASSNGAAAGFWETLYYAGYTVSTMGNGDFVPAGITGQLLTTVASVTGLLTLTMAITYLVPVLRAAADRRVLAATIDAIGATPADIAEGLWPDGRTGQHDSMVSELAQSIRRMTQAHSSYPVLHFFSSRHREVAIAPNVAALDEALATVVGDDPCSAPLPERTLHEAISSLLDALMASFVRVDLSQAPPPPALHIGLDENGRADRRRRLAAWCNDDGWTWEQAGGGGRSPSASTA